MVLHFNSFDEPHIVQNQFKTLITSFNLMGFCVTGKKLILINTTFYIYSLKLVFL